MAPRPPLGLARALQTLHAARCDGAATEAVAGVAKILRGFSLRFDRAGPLRYKYDLTLNLEGTTLCEATVRNRE